MVTGGHGYLNINCDLFHHNKDFIAETLKRKLESVDSHMLGGSCRQKKRKQKDKYVQYLCNSYMILLEKYVWGDEKKHGCDRYKKIITVNVPNKNSFSGGVSISFFNKKISIKPSDEIL